MPYCERLNGNGPTSSIGSEASSILSESAGVSSCNGVDLGISMGVEAGTLCVGLLPLEEVPRVSAMVGVGSLAEEGVELVVCASRQG